MTVYHLGDTNDDKTLWLEAASNAAGTHYACEESKGVALSGGGGGECRRCGTSGE